MNKETNNIPTTGAMLDSGNWVPVDASSLGFQINGAPNQIVAGPDGHYYRVNKPETTLNSVASNMQTAIPKPSSIVQMPPIVQPIALVPFTSQNQPMLQYDPYSRPVEPEITAQPPRYIKKAYKGISLIGLITSIASLVVMLLFAIGVFGPYASRSKFSLTGIDSVKSILNIFDIGGASDYYTYRILPIKGGGDFLTDFISYGTPILIVIIMVLFAFLILKYMIKLFSNKSPRSFSICAFINIILTLAVMAMFLSVTNGEVAADQKTQNLQKFFQFKSTVYMGIGLIVVFFTSIALFIIPFFSRKNAYILEKDSTKKTHIMSDKAK